MGESLLDCHPIPDLGKFGCRARVATELEAWACLRSSWNCTATTDRPFEMRVVSPVPWSDGPLSWASVSTDVDRSAELSIRTARVDDGRCEPSAVPRAGLPVPKGVSCYSVPTTQAK